MELTKKQCGELIGPVDDKVIGDIKTQLKDNKDIDYLQVFTLKKTYLGKTSFQKIKHTQEVPPLSESICFPFKKAVDQKVFCIDSEDYYTFLLADEY